MTLCRNCHALVYLINFLHTGYFFHAFIVMTFFSFFFSKTFRNTVRVSNGLYPEHDRLSVGHAVDPNCLQRLSADDKSRRYM